MTRDKYLRLYEAVYNRGRLADLLRVLSLAITALTVTVYGLAVVGFLLSDAAFALEFIAITAVPFLLVTLMRRIIDAPRPYEVIECKELAYLANSATEGHGFPSRHVASSMIIATSLSFVCLPVGLTVMAFGIVLGACRVLLGRHFIRDVIAGGIIGAVSGIVGMIIVNI